VAYAGGAGSSTPVAPVTASGLVLTDNGGNASVAALEQVAASRVFSARSMAGHAGSATGVLGAEASPPTTARPGATVTGRTVSAASVEPGAPSIVSARVAAGTSLVVAPAERTDAAPSAAGWNGSAVANGASSWSPVLLDASSAIGLMPATMTGALRPEMPATGGGDVLLGGVGDDLLVGGEGRDLLVGGYAAHHSEAAAKPVQGGTPLASYAVLDALLANGWAAVSGPSFEQSDSAGQDYDGGDA
jgi:hypothetical protein